MAGRPARPARRRPWGSPRSRPWPSSRPSSPRSRRRGAGVGVPSPGSSRTRRRVASVLRSKGLKFVSERASSGPVSCRGPSSRGSRTLALVLAGAGAKAAAGGRRRRRRARAAAEPGGGYCDDRLLLVFVCGGAGGGDVSCASRAVVRVQRGLRGAAVMCSLATARRCARALQGVRRGAARGGRARLGGASARRHSRLHRWGMQRLHTRRGAAILHPILQHAARIEGMALCTRARRVRIARRGDRTVN